MKRLFVATALIWGGLAVAVPATYDDLGGQSGGVNEFWNTTQRQQLRIDFATSGSATEVSSSVQRTWAFSSVAEIWSTIYHGFSLILK